jgi:hypothetical protein
MSKAARIAAPLGASTAPSGDALASIALFSGIGLLVSLIAVIMGVQGVWY